MSRPINDADRALLAAVKADPLAWELLAAKCRWEGMIPHAVLREWGDPRTWDVYKRRAVLPQEEK